MRVYPEQLEQYLKTELKPCYLIFGEEPLLKMEAIEFILTALFALFLCMILTLYPSIRASKQDPVKGLRYE